MRFPRKLQELNDLKMLTSGSKYVRNSLDPIGFEHSMLYNSDTAKKCDTYRLYNRHSGSEARLMLMK